MSFQTGLSGLNASARNLDVIGHNIANANTTGMKASRAEFAEVYASSLGAAGGANTGIGVQVAKVAQLFTQGNLKVTGNQLDLAINGSGFFSVARRQDGSETDVGEQLFTRNGEFKLDRDGFIVTNNGLNLLGTRVTPDLQRVGTEGIPVRLPGGGRIEGRATGSPDTPASERGIGMTATLNSNAQALQGFPFIPPVNPGDPTNPDFEAFFLSLPPGEGLSSLPPSAVSRTSLSVFDARGTPAQLDVYFAKISSTVDADGVTQNRWAVMGEIQGFDPFPLADVTFDGSGRPIDPIRFIDSTISRPASVVGEFPSEPLNLALNQNLFNLTEGNSFGIFSLRQDGYREGELTSLDINEAGILFARFSNGVSRPEFQIDLVNFRNLQGLEPVNGGFWRETIDSGVALRGSPQKGGLGIIRQSALEESNVDLTQELVNMIVAQRSYQANAQTIKTQDQVLQTLVNLR